MQTTDYYYNKRYLTTASNPYRLSTHRYIEGDTTTTVHSAKLLGIFKDITPFWLMAKTYRIKLYIPQLKLLLSIEKPWSWTVPALLQDICL